LARELHDDIGQILVGLRLHMEARVEPAPVEVVARWTEIVREVLEHLRQLTASLRPMSLSDRGLPTALGALGKLCTGGSG